MSFLTFELFTQPMCLTIYTFIFAYFLGSFSLSAVQSKIQKEREAEQLIQNGIQKKDNQLLAEGYYRKGKIDDGKGNLTEASKWFQKARLIYLKTGPSKELARILNRLSLIEYKQHHFPESIRLINESIQVAKEIKDERALYMGYSGRGLGIASLGLSNGDTIQLFKKVMHDFLLAEKIAQKLNDKEGLKEMYLMYGSIFQSLSMPHESLAFFLKIKPDYEKKELSQPKAIFLLRLALIYLDLNRIAESQQIILSIAPLIEDPEYADFSVLIFFHEVAGLFFEKTGNFKKAVQHHRAWVSLKEKISMQDNEGQLTHLNKKFELDARVAEIKQKNKEISLERKQKETQMALLIVSILFVLSSLLFLFNLFRLYLKYKQISKKNALLIHEQNHRVKNNLQVISSMLNIQANMSQQPEIVDIIHEIKLRINSMIELQKQLYNQDLELGSVQLKSVIQNLIDYASFNFTIPSVSINLQINEEPFDLDQSLAIILIINELITNSFKYAFHDIPYPSLSISFEKKNHFVHVAVKDNGIHPIIDAKILTENTTFGFRMIQLLLLQLDGHLDYVYHNGSHFNLTFKHKWKK